MFIDNFGIFTSEEYKKLKLACTLRHISNADVELFAQYRINEVYNSIWRHLRLHYTHGVGKTWYAREEYFATVRQVTYAYASWPVDNIITYLLSNGYISMCASGFSLQHDLRELSEKQMESVTEIKKICNMTVF